MDADDPHDPISYGRDDETLSTLKSVYPNEVCDDRRAIRAIIATGTNAGMPFWFGFNTLQFVDYNKGLLCVDGGKQECRDYAVKFCCRNQTVTTHTISQSGGYSVGGGAGGMGPVGQGRK